MNFADFQTFRDKLLRERPDVSDCAESNLYRSLARLAPPPTPEPAQQVHRCHLASEWCERFGFAPELARRALISCGVRDSLARLFAHYAQEQATLWLPSDHYPVYGALARAAGLVPREFPTLPVPLWPDTVPAEGTELLLVTNPLKPLGRPLVADDATTLEAWLAASPRRRVMLDTVYTFDTRFDAATLRLWATGQVLLLHSLTKGWLQPRLFGIALVPEADGAALTPAFRESAPPQASLARARECLNVHSTTPAAISAALGEAWTRMPLAASSPAVGYFQPVFRNWQELLATRHILGIPASVFGSSRGDITILSSLAFAR